MKAFELLAEIDEQHRLSAIVPEDTVPGQVGVIVLLSEAEDMDSEQALTSHWLAASTPSLQEMWDNTEDAVYNDL